MLELVKGLPDQIVLFLMLVFGGGLSPSSLGISGWGGDDHSANRSSASGAHQVYEEFLS